ncbi:MAG: hypothetical protein PHZ07_01615 [Patescibacteria group bacterium]|nr:hypothetical protein [Patescibacteria group bacterium]MDD4303869.1 hypothetical protein [Patescibacteria group bacterium]MDD4695144.1 hypothetical protein [Patescibacteria group bacterium]
MSKRIKKFKKSAKKLINSYYLKVNLSILVVALLSSLCLPQHSLAVEIENSLKNGEIELISGDFQANIEEFSILSENNPRLPQIEQKKPTKVVKMTLTAYNSDSAQTDDSPCITASGLDVCKRNVEDIVATNYMNLPFGTIIRIPELFGDRQFIIEDRMNARYTNTLDIWMKDYGNARKFGVKRNITVEIY